MVSTPSPIAGMFQEKCIFRAIPRPTCEAPAKKLAELFRNNFKAYENSASAEVRQAAVSA